MTSSLSSSAPPLHPSTVLLLDDFKSAEDDSPFHISEDLVQSPQHKTAGAASVDELTELLPRPLQLHEDLRGGCGGQLWPAGLVLSKYLLRNRDIFAEPKKIVELGAGGGLVGLAVALAHPKQTNVHITDQLPMLDLMRTNIALNKLQDQAHASIYDWGSSVPSHIPDPPDLVLAADCVYYEPAFPLLLETMRHLIKDNTVCYFCFKKRRRADLHFIKNARKFFDFKEVDDPDRPVFATENIYL